MQLAGTCTLNLHYYPGFPPLRYSYPIRWIAKKCLRISFPVQKFAEHRLLWGPYESVDQLYRFISDKFKVKLLTQLRVEEQAWNLDQLNEWEYTWRNIVHLKNSRYQIAVLYIM